MRADARPIIINALDVHERGGEIVLSCEAVDGHDLVLQLNGELVSKLAAALKARDKARVAGQECLHPGELNASNDD
jgi:hypothetical protein